MPWLRSMNRDLHTDPHDSVRARDNTRGAERGDDQTRSEREPAQGSGRFRISRPPDVISREHEPPRGRTPQIRDPSGPAEPQPLSNQHGSIRHQSTSSIHPGSRDHIPAQSSAHQGPPSPLPPHYAGAELKGQATAMSTGRPGAIRQSVADNLPTRNDRSPLNIRQANVTPSQSDTLHEQRHERGRLNSSREQSDPESMRNNIRKRKDRSPASLQEIRSVNPDCSPPSSARIAMQSRTQSRPPPQPVSARGGGPSGGKSRTLQPNETNVMSASLRMPPSSNRDGLSQQNGGNSKLSATQRRQQSAQRNERSEARPVASTSSQNQSNERSHSSRNVKPRSVSRHNDQANVPNAQKLRSENGNSAPGRQTDQRNQSCIATPSGHNQQSNLPASRPIQALIHNPANCDNSNTRNSLQGNRSASGNATNNRLGSSSIVVVNPRITGNSDNPLIAQGSATTEDNNRPVIINHQRQSDNNANPSDNRRLHNPSDNRTIIRSQAQRSERSRDNRNSRDRHSSGARDSGDSRTSADATNNFIAPSNRDNPNASQSSSNHRRTVINKVNQRGENTINRQHSPPRVHGNSSGVAPPQGNSLERREANEQGNTTRHRDSQDNRNQSGDTNTLSSSNNPSGNQWMPAVRIPSQSLTGRSSNPPGAGHNSGQLLIRTGRSNANGLIQRPSPRPPPSRQQIGLNMNNTSGNDTCPRGHQQNDRTLDPSQLNIDIIRNPQGQASRQYSGSPPPYPGLEGNSRNITMNVGPNPGINSRVSNQPTSAVRNEALPDILNSVMLPPYTPRPNQSRSSRHGSQRHGHSGTDDSRDTRSAHAGHRHSRRPPRRTTLIDEEGEWDCAGRLCCLKCLTLITTFRWVLVFLALLGVCCVLTGIILGALHLTIGSSFLTLSLMFIGELFYNGSDMMLFIHIDVHRTERLHAKRALIIRLMA